MSQTTTLVGCNNEAELRALCMAAQALVTHEAQTVIVLTDSRVLLEQLHPKANTRTIHRLAILTQETADLLAQLQQVYWQWIPRHRNTEADTLARAALGLPPKIKPPAGKVRKRFCY
jgi:ribonuclease HI